MCFIHSKQLNHIYSFCLTLQRFLADRVGQVAVDDTSGSCLCLSKTPVCVNEWRAATVLTSSDTARICRPGDSLPILITIEACCN